MDLFEYISVLTSIIIGLGIARLLRGVIEMIHYPADGRHYTVHLVWMLNTFLMAVVWWWFEFTLVDSQTWSYGAYIFLIMYAIFIYLLCAVLVPTRINTFGDYKNFFYAKRSWFFSFLILQRGIDIIDTFAKGGLDRYLSFGPSYWLGGPLQMILFAIAIWTRNEKFHSALAVTVLLLQVWIVILLFPTMS